MRWWITSMDGEISFGTQADSADEARLLLARKYRCETFEEFCEKADYAPASFTVARVVIEPRPPSDDVGFIGPPPDLLTRAFLIARQAARLLVP